MKRLPWFLGVVGAAAIAGAGCELLVTFPASEIDGGEMDGAAPDVSTTDTGSMSDTMSPDAPPDVKSDSAHDAPADVSGDKTTPADSPQDVAPDTTGDVKSADAPADSTPG